MVSSELKGLSVLITRPQEQSEASATVIVEQGGNPIIFPTLEIVPVEPLGGWALLMERLKTADIAVFTSANAVRQLFSQGGGITGRCQVAAIGTATQMALAEFGVSCDWLPMTDYRSEGLLELPVFQAVAQKKILLFAGEGGREYLQDILTGRGAIVEKIAVYRRLCPNREKAPLKAFFAQAGPKIVVSTSVESLFNLRVLSEGVGDPRELPILVISERMAAVAREQGFKSVVIAENASNETMLRALVFWLGGSC